MYGMFQLNLAEAVDRKMKLNEISRIEWERRWKGLVNRKILSAITADKEKIEMSFKKRFITEEELFSQVEEVYKKYDQIEEDFIEWEDAEIVRYVKAHEQVQEVAKFKDAKEHKDEEIVDREYD